MVNAAFGADPETDGQRQAEAEAALARLRALLGQATDRQPVLGAGELDEYGEMAEHAVALTANEIETLYTDHAHSAKIYRPRKRQKQSERDAMLHGWHKARVALFDRLMPVEDSDAPNPVYGEDGALVDISGGPEA